MKVTLKLMELVDPNAGVYRGVSIYAIVAMSPFSVHVIRAHYRADGRLDYRRLQVQVGD